MYELITCANLFAGLNFNVGRVKVLAEAPPRNRRDDVISMDDSGSESSGSEIGIGEGASVPALPAKSRCAPCSFGTCQFDCSILKPKPCVVEGCPNMTHHVCLSQHQIQEHKTSGDTMDGSRSVRCIPHCNLCVATVDVGDDAAVAAVAAGAAADGVHGGPDSVHGVDSPAAAPAALTVPAAPVASSLASSESSVLNGVGNFGIGTDGADGADGAGVSSVGQDGLNSVEDCATLLDIQHVLASLDFDGSSASFHFPSDQQPTEFPHPRSITDHDVKAQNNDKKKHVWWKNCGTYTILHAFFNQSMNSASPASTVTFPLCQSYFSKLRDVSYCVLPKFLSFEILIAIYYPKRAVPLVTCGKFYKLSSGNVAYCVAVIRFASQDQTAQFGRAAKSVLVLVNSEGKPDTYSISSSNDKRAVEKYPDLVLLDTKVVASELEESEVVVKYFSGLSSGMAKWIRHSAVQQTTEFFMNPVLCDQTFFHSYRKTNKSIFPVLFEFKSKAAADDVVRTPAAASSRATNCRSVPRLSLTPASKGKDKKNAQAKASARSRSIRSRTSKTQQAQQQQAQQQQQPVCDQSAHEEDVEQAAGVGGLEVGGSVSSDAQVKIATLTMQLEAAQKLGEERVRSVQQSAMQQVEIARLQALLSASERSVQSR